MIYKIVSDDLFSSAMVKESGFHSSVQKKFAFALISSYNALRLVKNFDCFKTRANFLISQSEERPKPSEPACKRFPALVWRRLHVSA